MTHMCFGEAGTLPVTWPRLLLVDLDRWNVGTKRKDFCRLSEGSGIQVWQLKASLLASYFDIHNILRLFVITQ